MTVAVWPTASPVPGAVIPDFAALLVAVGVLVAVELPTGVAPAEDVEALLDDPPLLPHAPSVSVINTADIASRPRCPVLMEWPPLSGTELTRQASYRDSRDE